MTFGEYLAHLRQSRGLSQKELAAELQVSRQTIIALEHNQHAPSFDLAVRIARRFDVSLDSMAAALTAVATDAPVWFPGSPPPRSPLPVVWSRVASRLVIVPLSLFAHQPPADAVWDPATGQLHPLPGARVPEQVILAGGCDPFHHWLATAFHQLAPDLCLETVHLSSTEALRAFNDGWLHLAGTHLFDEVSRRYNPPHLAAVPHVQIPYVRWEEGLMHRPDSDAVRHIAVREPGSEAHALYRRHREEAPYPAETFYTHLSILEAVSQRPGWAGVGLGPLAALRGLSFRPWALESYDLWIRQSDLKRPWVEALVGALEGAWLKSQFHALPHCELAPRS
ncbi:MAG: helix-turn-helix domain-containing protein [Firmicutes bacterium]|nr:helix-turn-helix domain-containing protein [Bacillota bacterium]